MGTGIHGGFGTCTKGATDTCVAPASDVSNENKDDGEVQIKLPVDDSQLKHIFANRDGQLPDTPSNRHLLIDLANNQTAFLGQDKYGNLWNAEQISDNGQNRVRYRNDIINDGGRNSVARVWDNDTGLNNNPVKRGKK